jgi:hypothetical protein
MESDARTEQQRERASFDEGVVAKPFNSEYRRHVVGDPIARADLEKSRLNFDHLVDNGFIEPKAEAKGEK